MTSHLFAMGEGSYIGPYGGPSPMWRRIFSCTGKAHPKVCMIPTASGDNRESIANFTFGMNRLQAHPNFLSLFAVPTADLASWIMEFDAIYVSGGNTRNLLALWREWGLDGILKQAWQRGVVLFGGSAGAVCWFEQGNSDFIPGQFNPLDALGWLPGSLVPHYAIESPRRPSYLAQVASGRLKPGYGLGDRSVLHYVDGTLAEALCEHPDSGIFRVERSPEGTAIETRVAAVQVT
jgi:dipeptidase E